MPSPMLLQEAQRGWSPCRGPLANRRIRRSTPHWYRERTKRPNWMVRVSSSWAECIMVGFVEDLAPRAPGFWLESRSRYRSQFVECSEIQLAALRRVVGEHVECTVRVELVMYSASPWQRLGENKPRVGRIVLKDFILTEDISHDQP